MDTNLHQRVILRLHNAWQLRLLGICLIAAVSSVAAFAQIPQTLTPAEATQVRRLIQTWLECSVCDNVDSSPELRSVIERGGAAIEPLRTALLEGPLHRRAKMIAQILTHAGQGVNDWDAKLREHFRVADA